MRLINVRTLRIEEFLEHVAPPYAVLSHTWGNGEVSLQAYEAAYDQPESPTRSSEGYRKISRVCSVAGQRGLWYCWVDTCCIDKTSSAELSEAINSMFRWYRQATACIVYLEDFRCTFKDGQANNTTAITHCRWFTRGWTLQELIASNSVYFYDSTWLYFANKLDLHHQLSAITAIDHGVLLDQEAFRRRPVACRLSWASKRVTTRVEDRAYCLLGILEVNMPLIYGEGANAFRRLQHEVLQKHDDPSLFVWKAGDTPISLFQHMLAQDVASFTGCEHIRWRDESEHSMAATQGPSYAVTTRGIRVQKPSLRLVRRADNDDRVLGYQQEFPMLVDGDPNGFLANMTPSQNMRDRQGSLGITLRKVGPGTYARERARDGTRRQPSMVDNAVPEDDIYILDESEVRSDQANFFVECGPGLVQLSLTPFHFSRPRASWDSARSCFMSRPDENFRGYIKIYPDANVFVPESDNFGFFVLTYWRASSRVAASLGRPKGPLIEVELVPQEVWKTYEHIRQDGEWITKLAADDAYSNTVKLGSSETHQIGQYWVVAKLDFEHDPQTKKVDMNKLTLNLSLAGVKEGVSARGYGGTSQKFS